MINIFTGTLANVCNRCRLRTGCAVRFTMRRDFDWFAFVVLVLSAAPPPISVPKSRSIEQNYPGGLNYVIV